MVKTPIVKLYYPNETEVLLDNENLCFKGLIAFNYKYSEKKGDKGSLTFRFNEPFPFSLRWFEPGTFYKIKWGYLKNLSPFRLVAISKVATTFDSSGYTLKIEIIPKIDFIDGGKGGWNTVEEALRGLKDVYIEYEWYDLYGARHIVRYTPREGKDPIITVIDFREWAKDPLNKEIDLPPFPEMNAGMYGIYGVAPPEPPPQPNLSDLDKVFLKLFGVSRDSMADSLRAILDAYLANFLRGHFLETRDKNLTIKVADVDSLSLFTFDTRPNFKPSFLISCTAIKGPATSGGVGGTATTVNPLEKEVNTSVYGASDLPDIIPIVIRDLETGEDVERTFTLIKETSGFFYESVDKKFKIPADDELIKEFILEYKKHMDPSSGLYKEENYQKWPYDTYKGFPEKQQDILPSFFKEPRTVFPRKTWEDLRLSQFQIGVKARREVDYDNVVPLTIQTMGGYSKDQALNRVQNAVLDLFFNNLQGVLVVEGLPPLEVGFNFNILGMGDLVDGKYHCSSCNHVIQGGKYTTSLTGDKVPINYKAKLSRVTQTVEDFYGDLLEESRAPVAETFNARFALDQMVNLWGGDPASLQVLTPPGFPILRAQSDADLPGTSVAPTNFWENYDKTKNPE